MVKRVMVFMLVAVATLQVLQAMGLDEMSFPDVLDEESNTTLSMLVPLSLSWNMSTQWLGALRSSYSHVLRYETSDTLSRITHLSENIQTGANKYKDEVKHILEDVGNPHYSNCTEDKKFVSIQQVLARTDSQLQGCTVPLKTLKDKYEATLDSLATQIDSRGEEAIYTPCLPTEYTVATINRANKCLYAKLQEALSGFYYPTGASVLRAVAEHRSSIAQARDVAHACAVTALSPALAEAIGADLEATRKCLDAPHERAKRGFGRKFKKFFRKAKNGIKKICSKVPCQVGYSIPFGG